MPLVSEIPLEDITPKSLQQRRRFARRPFNATVELLTPKAASGVTINVSEGGLRIAVDRVLDVGDMTLLQVRDGGQPQLKRARVVWTQPTRDGCIAGLEFVGLH